MSGTHLHKLRRSSRSEVPEASQHPVPVEYASAASGYSLISMVGYGASSQVWLAETGGNKVAVKVIDLEKFDGMLDKADGSVLTLLQSAYPQGLDEGAAAAIMKPVLKALDYLHSSSPPILHRDVKAGNILIDAPRGRVLLADLGVAAAQQQCFGDGGGIPKTGQYLHRFSYVGSPAWMAPEVMEQCDRGHDQAADLYSFGITLIELVCGRAPFTELPFMVQAVSKLQHDAPTLASMNCGKTFSPEIEDVVAKCLCRDPERRQSAATLLKHPFFKNVHSKQLREVLQTLMAQVAPLSERLEKVCDIAKGGSSGNLKSGGGLLRRHQDWQRLESLRALDGGKSLERLTPEHASRILDTIMALPAKQKKRTKHLLMPKVFRRSISPLSTVHHVGKEALSKVFETVPSFGQSHSAPDLHKPPEQHWIPLEAFRLSPAIAIGSSNVGGIGFQATFGSTMLFARLECNGGMIWAGPAYFYLTTAVSAIGVGDYRRDRVVLVPTAEMLHSLKSREINGPGNVDLKVMGQLDWGYDEIMSWVHKAQREERCTCLMFATEEGSHLGLTLPRASIHPDHDANEKLYGRPCTPTEIFEGKLPPPPQFERIIAQLRALDAAAQSELQDAGAETTDGTPDTVSTST
ncbi:hypothetical protein WJX73_001626 [Symbiochloris irregularis]|uniref:Protein kinase domain-containing protein n=1 Tax=Symbiochloris irregularis TaxID=706552 RepID=A0AAW1Q321_9CHLO